MQLSENILTIDAAPVSQLDLSRALKVRMYDRRLTREYEVDEFEVRRSYPLSDGLKVQLVNESEGLYVPLVFRPEKSGFRVTLPAAEINEQLGINRKAMAIGLLPELMNTRVGDDGWFLLPCYTGTLVDFRDRHPQVNRDRLYMEQPEWEKMSMMNCFGMKSGGQAALGIVHKGDFFCHVTSEYNQEGENRIYPSFGLRHKPGDAVKPEDKEVVFRFHGDDAGWPQMARTYRRYLVEEREVSPLKDRIERNPTLRYSVDAMRVKIFHGLKKPLRPDGSSPMRKYATFEQAEQILDRMHEAGIEKAVVTLVGWNMGGHDGAYPTHFPVEPALGGEDKLRRLIQKGLDMGYQVVPHDNVTDIYRGSPDFDYEYVARDPDGEPRVVGVWGGGQSYKACPVVYLDRWGSEMSRIRELGFDGHYYMDAQASVLWQCHSDRHPADEELYALSLSRMTQIPRTIYGAVSVEMGPAYILPFIDEAANIAVPVHCSWAFNRCPEAFQNLVDDIVPFYAVAVHGLVTYQAGWIHSHRDGGTWKGALAALAMGARPCMEVSYTSGANGDHYEDSIRDIQRPYQLAFEELEGIHAEVMENYEKLGPEANCITYGDGTTVAINWSKEPCAGLDPLSCEIDRPAH